MKLNEQCYINNAGEVASLAEAWIEIRSAEQPDYRSSVASLAEAWIEMCSRNLKKPVVKSPPSRRRGLK